MIILTARVWLCLVRHSDVDLIEMLGSHKSLAEIITHFLSSLPSGASLTRVTQADIEE